ncbi:hypothetical protein [Plastoroseomonas hellenica]|uniref:hypothetical protein n=1 Tax=Plastoroseomonas hellenica TaxID=2687306 RepID=UPI001BA5C099|nr:hypothetical protein [Plastoroseomonas hellenica]MBR0641462.1 hypothetical protein [Plastoroseomonas hellenica]
MIGGNAMRAPRPKVLCDFREGGGMRGFHLSASLSHLVAAGLSAELWAVHSGTDDAFMELQLLRQDAGQDIPRWNPAIKHVRFALYAVMADVMPMSATFEAARSCARRTLVGLMFPEREPPHARDLTVTDGHDTRAFALQLAALQPRPRPGLLGRFWP